MNNNKLIAEFMGLETPDGCYFEHLTKEGNRELTHHILLQYHTSWDWLMPVVQKCYKIDNEEGFDNLVDAVSTLDIDGTYNAVIEFIEEYNESNKMDNLSPHVQ